MDVIVPKYIELLASNVAESNFSLWSTATTYDTGDKAYELYSDFPELLSYGNALFDAFETGTGWSFVGTESAYECDGTQVAESLLYQTVTSSDVAEDDYVLVTFQLVSRTAGEIAPYAAGTSGTGRTVAGWYQEVIQAGSGAGVNIGLVADSDFAGVVTNIRIKRTSINTGRKIYECLSDTISGTLPSESTDWVKVATSNRWKMFDGYMSSTTERFNKTSVKVKTDKCSSLSFFETTATDLEHILSDDSFTETSTTSMTPGSGDKAFVMTTTNTIWAVGENVEIYRTSDARAFMAGEITAWDSGTGGITVSVTTYDDPAAAAPYTDWTIVRVYDHESVSLKVSQSLSWSDYFFGTIEYSKSAIKQFTYGFNTSLRAIFTGATGSMVKVGHFVVGRSIYLGKTLYGVRAGITSFSVKTANDFGEYTLTPRSSANELRYTILVASGGENAVHQTLKALDAIPCVWDANGEDTEYTFAIVYGFFSDFDVSLPDYNYSECDLEIQGLA
jgi:hypothetical protein